MWSDGDGDKPNGDSRAHQLVEYARAQAEPTLRSRMARTPRELPDDLFPGYTLVANVSHGGQGRVYEAVDNSTQRRVAIKVLRSGPFGGEAQRGRFEREIQILAQLQHPNIVTIHSSGTVALQRYFVMDFIDGQPLDEYLAGNRLSIEQTLAVFLRICEAVNAAHLRGIVHRDLKPSNIRIDEHGEPHVLDFGLAKAVPDSPGGPSNSLDATVDGQFVGSLPWAAPEQVMNTPGAIDLRTDVYGLGLLLYFMLTQSFPYERRANLRDMTDSILRSDPIPPSTLRREIDDELSTIVLMCLQKDPLRRYQIAGELARDIKRYRAGEPIEAKRDSAGYLLAKTIRRHRGLAILAAAFVLLSIGYGVAMSFLYQRATRSERLAQERADDVSAQYAITREAIGFLVDEVSSKLSKTPGNTRIRRDILEGVFDQLLPLVERNGDDPLLLEDLMRVHYQLGDIAIALRRFEQARQHLQQALDLRLRLSPREAQGPEELADLSINYVLIGDAARKAGDLNECERMYTEALDIDEALAAAHPDSAHFLDNLAWSYDRLGALAASGGDPLAAEVLYRKQSHIMQRLVKENPRSIARLHGLAAAHTRLGQCAVRRCDWLEAIDHCEQAVAIGRRILDAGSKDSLHWYTHIVSICTYDYVYRMGHADAELGPILLEARDLAEQLIEREPDLPRNHHALVLTNFRIVNSAAGRQDPARLEQHARESLTAIQAYLEFTKLTPKVAWMQSSGVFALAEALHAQGREAEAVGLRRVAVTSIEDALNAGLDAPELRIQLADLLRGDPAVPQDERIAAVDAARRSVESASDSKPTHIASVGRMYHAAGDFEAAIEMLEQAQAAYAQLEADLPPDDARALRQCRAALDE